VNLKTFASAPALVPAYLKILLSRKPRQIEGAIPRIEAVLTGFKVDRAQLGRYRQICADRGTEFLPIAFPHVMASPVHLALLTADEFPLNPMGIVHMRNLIVQKRPLRADESGDLHVSIEGGGEALRGQELILRTQVQVDGEAVWTETSTLLVRKIRQKGFRPDSAAAEAFRLPQREPGREFNFSVLAGTGRRYARVSGDFNPIHLADIWARLYGFKSAVAHGMWSLARCAAALEPEALYRPCALDVAFKLPISFPAEVAFESWSSSGSHGFVLREAQGTRPHLLGKILPA
jgi:acyl dehydratase